MGPTYRCNPSVQIPPPMYGNLYGGHLKRWPWVLDSRRTYSLELAMTTTDFFCAVVITNSCLKYLQALTSSLQAEAKDIVTAVNEIDTVTTTLQSVRDNIGTHHSQWFSTVEKMCADVGTEPSLPRRSGRQIHRSNVPADTAVQYRSPCSITCYLRSRHASPLTRRLLY